MTKIVNLTYQNYAKFHNKKQKLVKFVQFPLIQHIKIMPISVFTTFQGIFKAVFTTFQEIFIGVFTTFQGIFCESGGFCGGDGWWGLAVVGRFMEFLVAELAGGGFVAARAGAFARLLVSPHTPCRQPHCQQHQYQYNPALYVHCFKIH